MWPRRSEVYGDEIIWNKIFTCGYYGYNGVPRGSKLILNSAKIARTRGS